MAKRKATEVELESGIGEKEVEESGIEPEAVDEERFTGFAQDEENEMDDEMLIKEYHEAVKQAEKEGE